MHINVAVLTEYKIEKSSRKYFLKLKEFIFSYVPVTTSK